MKILERAKLFLKVTRMSQQELSAKIGVHPVSLCRFLNNTSGEQASVAVKLDAFLDDNGFAPECNVTQETSKEERENAS